MLCCVVLFIANVAYLRSAVGIGRAPSLPFQPCERRLREAGGPQTGRYNSHVLCLDADIGWDFTYIHSAAKMFVMWN